MKSITRQQAAAQVCWQSYFGEKKFKVLGKTCLEHRRKEGKRRYSEPNNLEKLVHLRSSAAAAW